MTTESYSTENFIASSFLLNHIVQRADFHADEFLHFSIFIIIEQMPFFLYSLGPFANCCVGWF